MTVLVPPPGQVLHWLGGPVDVRVEIDTGLEGTTLGDWDGALWDTDLWGLDDPGWADLTPYVFSVSIDGGSRRWGERFDARSAVVTVDDTTGIFTPESGVEPWPLPFRPGRTLRIVAIPDATTGTKVALFTGEIDSTEDRYDDAGHHITTDIICNDFLARMARVNPLMMATATGVQSTDERVDAALDRMAVPPTTRDIQTGLHTMQTSFLAQTVLEECQRAADAEGGAFYIAPDGVPTFRARDWLITDPRSVNIQGYLGYTSLPVPGSAAVWDTALWDTGVWEGFERNAAHILSVQTSWETARIVNQVAFARVGSEVQEAEDVPSQDEHGIRSYQRTDLENNTDTEVAFLAARHVAAFKDSRMRVEEVTIATVEDEEGEDRHRLLYDTKFGDRLSILIQSAWGWSVEKEVHVMGISHQITADDWIATFQLDDAQTYEGSI
jgi:hypothetical protein